MKEKEALPSGALTVSILKLSLDKGAKPVGAVAPRMDSFGRAPCQMLTLG